MATLVLGAAASAFAGSVGASPVVSALLSGAAAIGGAYADNLIAGALAPTQRASVRGPKISDLRLQTSTEGAPIPEAYGRVRLAGQVIWATRLRMEVNTSTERTGGKGGGGGTEVTRTTYSYFANFAVGLSEGAIKGIGRVWADGKILDLTAITHRVYLGTEDQQPDPFIAAKEGAAPAYAGTAYVVFEDLALGDFGNRIPQLEFEVFRQLDGVEKKVQGMVVIPGSGEWVYATEEVRKGDPDAEGVSATENVNNQVGGPDWTVAIDDLERTFSGTGSVLLVVAWFGTDLRCGTCEVRPGVEFGADKSNMPYEWDVHGLDRGAAYLVSRDPDNPDRPVYGGTPSDRSIVQAIRDLKARGLDVVFYPFLLMDILAGNALPDPYGGAEQLPHPWRGRITCHPAAGQPGTVDKTAAAASQVSAFFGSAGPADLSVSVDPASNAVTTSYSGPAEWGLRRMILHYAKLCAAINAVDPGAVSAFVIGSELRGLTTIRSSQSTYPGVAELVTLAADCKAVLGGVDVTYAADWSEYRGHDPADGSGDFHFHLDPLWSSSDIDAVAIDNYMKLSDWRDGTAHADALAGWPSILDLGYLKSNVAGGEDYDWYYASDADRDAQIRTPISDGDYGEAWTFRTKDIRSWWETIHRNRPGGLKGGSYPAEWTATNTTSLVIRKAEEDGAGNLRLTIDWVVDNSGGGGTVFPRVRVSNTHVPDAAPGEAWTGEVTGRVVSATHTLLVHLEEVNASKFYRAGSNTPFGTVEGTTSVSRTFSHPEAAHARLLIGPNVPAGEVLSATFEMTLPVLKQSGGVNEIDTTLSGAVTGDVSAPALQTGWVPGSKPVWFTEYGFPSVDKATNQPNVFVDPKSSESAFPYYSNETRDDVIQRRGIEALLDYWDPAAGNNPVSGVYGVEMLDLSRAFLWTWDARPFPAWPDRDDVWGDTANWQFGHWVQGKAGSVSLAELIREICLEVGFTAIDVSKITGIVTGFLRSAIASPRAQLEILSDVFRFDMVESGGVIAFLPRGQAASGSLTEAELAAPDRDQADWQVTRAQETDLPLKASLAYWDAGNDYRQTTSTAGRLVTPSERVESLSAPLVMDPAEADTIVESWLLERWTSRERADFALPPSRIRFDPGDVLELTTGGRSRPVRMTRVVDAGARQCEAVSVDPSGPVSGGTAAAAQRSRSNRTASVPTYGEAVLEVLDLPVLSETQVEHRPWLAAFAAPFAGVRVLEDTRDVATIDAPATLGRTVTDLHAGTPYRFDRANSLTVKLSAGPLASVSEDTLLGGTGNALAVQNAEGDWEILQFASAELIGTNTWQLSGLLRGRRGTEHAMRSPVAAGARVVLLDEALTQADVPLIDRGIARTWTYGPAPKPSSDPTFKSRLTTFEAVALKPFAPVHLRGTRNPTGDLLITWIRRARQNGGWQDGTDIPLGEAAEAYALEVLDGGSVVRTVSGLTTPAHTYTADDQIADFGSAQSSVTIRALQISDTVGRGIPTDTSL